MGRSRARGAAWVVAGGVAYVQALGGCEAVLGVGSLTERGKEDGGGRDSTMRDGSRSTAEGGTDAATTQRGGDSGGNAAIEAGEEGSVACVGTVGVVDGNCSGPCVPNATKCVGNGLATCGTSGQWGSAVTCASNQSCSSGSCVAIQSCKTSGAGLNNCGAGSESCCTSLEVAGGTYDRTYTSSGGGPMGEADPASVSGFRLDKYLVTVGRFRQFVTAWDNGAGYTPPAASGKHTHLNGGSGLNATGGGYEPGWVTSDNSNIAPTNANLACDATYPTWTNTAGSQENLPMNCVTWYESYAFCIWDGGFLPSESEWEYAAAGGSQQREYPWGTTDPGTGNQYAIYNCNYPSGSGSCTSVSNIAPVGTATQGAGLWGQLDLAGNMWEWNLDWYASSYVEPGIDCANLTSASYRVFRGGSFSSTASILLPPSRLINRPADRNYVIGFRCARTP
jgi:sulfatase modifying factor 1